MSEKKWSLRLQKVLVVVGFPVWFPIVIVIGFVTMAWAVLSAMVEMLFESERHE